MNFIEKYCSHFPAVSAEQCFEMPFEDVMVWITKWHKEHLYQERYAEIDKTLPRA